MIPKYDEEYLEYREIIPETILDFKGLRKSILHFKYDQAVEVLMRYFEKEYSVDNYSRFTPTIITKIPNSEDQSIDTGTHGIGIFSTALCLETVAAYSKNVNESNKHIDHQTLVWEKGPNRRNHEATDRRKKRIQPNGMDDRREATLDRRTEHNIIYGQEKAHEFFEFIIKGLSGDFGPKLGFLARIATLFRFGNYLDGFGIREKFVNNAKPDIQSKFNRICIECIFSFNSRFTKKREGIHPFELYRFLQFVRQWGVEIYKIFPDSCELNTFLKENGRTDYYHFTECLREEKELEKNRNNSNFVFYHFFNQVYLFAKYELYRQMSLKQSGDSRLFDAKRLIYALLVVYLDNRFSNALVRKHALDLIFDPFKNDRNAIWPTGQQVAMSKDGLMIISDNECVCDLLGCDYLSESLLVYISELKCMYDGYTRTKRTYNGKITGWYPIHQRDQKPTSWCTALTLSFIKRFCKLISLKLAKMAKEKFRSNYKRANISWDNIFDCTASKAKIRLIFPEKTIEKSLKKGTDIIKHCKYRTAILFGPPGTGKTTFGRAVATKLGLDYLELTPGDFFSGGENSILVTINDIFEHLLHLKNTVVFIDEIDDLVKNRNPQKKENAEKNDQPYDPRTLFVNSLLPRFQELHDKENIILLMATNNIERVDDAISRMGRVDLVIPVGAISPHGRLKFLKIISENDFETFNRMHSWFDEEWIDFAIDFLNATEAFSYGILKHYTNMIIRKIKEFSKGGVPATTIEVRSFLQKQIAENKADNPLLIWDKNVIKDNHCYDTRPKHEEGDFHDFGHFSFHGYHTTKKTFQIEFVKLFIILNFCEIDVEKAREIEKTLSYYCKPFPMREITKENQTVENPCNCNLYNILTPFYDDIERIITAIEKENGDADTKNTLITARGYLDKMIFDRPILPE